MRIDIPEHYISEIPYFRREAKTIESQLNNRIYIENTLGDLNRTNIRFESIVTAGLGKNTIESEIREYFSILKNNFMADALLSFGHQGHMAIIIQFISRHIILDNERAQGKSYKALGGSTLPGTQLVWKHTADNNALVGEYVFKFSEPRNTDDPTDYDDSLLMTVTGQIHLIVNSDKAFVRYGKIKIETHFDKIFRFSKVPVFYSLEHGADWEQRDALLKIVKLLPFLEDSRLADLTSRSKATDYLFTFGFSSEDNMTMYVGEQRELLLLVKSNCKESIRKDAVNIYNNRYLWNKINENFECPVPDRILELLKFMSANDKFYKNHILRTSGIKFTKHASVKYGIFKNTNVMWWISYFGNVNGLLGKIVKFNATTEQNYSEYGLDRPCKGAGPYQGVTPILNYASENKFAEVRLLLNHHRIDIQAQYEHPSSKFYQCNLLYFCLYFEQWDLAKILIDHDIDVTNLDLTKGYERKDTILAKMISASRYDLLKEILIKKNVQMNPIKLPLVHQTYPAYFAAAEGRWDVFSILVKYCGCFSNHVYTDFPSFDGKIVHQNRRNLSVTTLLVLDLHKDLISLKDVLEMFLWLMKGHESFVANRTDFEVELKNQRSINQSEINGLYEHLHDVAYYNAAVTNTSCLGALAQYNDPNGNEYESVRFYIISNLYESFIHGTHNNTQTIRLNLQDYLNPTPGLNLSLRTISDCAAQMGEYPFLEKLFSQGANMRFCWLQKYGKSNSLPSFVEQSTLKGLIDAINHIRDFAMVKWLLNANEVDFTDLYSHPLLSQQCYFIAVRVGNIPLMHYLNDKCSGQPILDNLPQMVIFNNQLKSMDSNMLVRANVIDKQLLQEEQQKEDNVISSQNMSFIHP